jgi:hypothetical protein
MVTPLVMFENESPICAGPMSKHFTVLVESLRLEGIPARVVAIENVEPARRPVWACTPGNEVYVVVPKEHLNNAREVQRWTGRLCLSCETTLLAKVRACQKCGAIHPMEPGPVW